MMARRLPVRRGERGVVLVNVLVILALASTVVLVMIAYQDAAIVRTQRFSEAAQAASYTLGGEASAAVALRRDGVEQPETDHYGEAWAALAEQNAPIEYGTFSLTIRDAQARFNINNLVDGGVTAEETLRQIVRRLELPSGAADLIMGNLERNGPAPNLDALSGAGLRPEEIAVLSALCIALPTPTRVNINTAPEPLIAILLDNPASASLLAARREREGFLTPEDVKSARVILPPGLGFTSDYYWVDTDVTVGGVSQQLTSLLQRRVVDGRVEVAAIARIRNHPPPGR